MAEGIQTDSIAVMVYVVACLFWTVLGAYTRLFQQATMRWGKALAPDNALLPRGMQDAITPSSQTVRNIVSPLLFLVVVVAGFFLFRWYIATGIVVALMFLGSLVQMALPKPTSPFFYFRLTNELRSRKAAFLSHNDLVEAELIDEILTKMASLAQIDAVRPTVGRDSTSE